MNYRVLIIEDDPMVEMINSQFVTKNEGFSIAGTCRNGQEALDYLKNNEVDLILLDVYMPVMDGRETLRRLREMNVCAEVIMVTAANDSTTIEETFQYGVLDYLIKPFTFERFSLSLSKFCEKRTLLRENPVMDQSCVDSLLQKFSPSLPAAVKSPAAEDPSLKKLPKGIQKRTLLLIQEYFGRNSEWNSVDMIASELGISIVTVRNYVNFLVQERFIREDINYETGGRPSMLYKKL